MLRQLSLGALVLSTGAFAFLVFVAPAVLGEGTSSPLAEVPKAHLQAGGLSLAAPSAEDSKAVAISREQALELALAAIDERDAGHPEVKEVALATLTDNFQSPAFECLCWLVSVDPSEMVFYGPTGNTDGYRASYSLIVIDARSGVALFWRTGGSPPR